MHTSIHNLRYYIAAAGLLLVATVSGDPPAWWSEGDPPVIDTTANPNNHGPANVGQAKWMVHSAIEALRPIHPELASEIKLKLVGEEKIIKSLAPPANDADREKNHAPLLVGQLKAIATPFYDAIHTADPEWLELQLIQNQTKDATDPTNYYPWTKTPADDQNRAIASIGQLKAVFTLRFQTLTNAAIDSDRDGLPDRWETTHFGNLNTSGFQDSDSDGLDNAQEQNLGTNPGNTDSDDDGMMDGEDADPLDEVIDWRKTPGPSWIAWDLSTLNVASDWTLTDLSSNGTMLFTAPDHSFRLIYELQSARILANSSNSQFYTTPLSGVLHGDRVFGRREVEGEGGIIRTEWVYLDPSNNKVVVAGVHPNNPPEHIWDATSLNVSGVGGGNTVQLTDSSGFSGTRFESNENAVAALTWAPLGYETVKYWTYANGKYDAGRFIPFPIVSRFTPDTQTTATFRQTSPSEDEIIRHIIPSGSGVYVAKEGEGFRTSGIAVEKHTLLKPFSATSQGWLIQVDEESVPRVWANGKWHLLKHLVGRNASGEFLESVEPVKIGDNGQMVARIRYPNQAAPHYALLSPATAIELSPKLVNQDDQVIPGSERPNHLLRDQEGIVLSPLSTTNAMVERDPTPALPVNQIQDASTRRIAWREINVKISKLLAGRTVTWSMTPQFTPSEEFWPGPPFAGDYRELRQITGGPRFRGSWAHAYRSEDGQVDYRRSFSPSETYAAHDFAVLTPTNESSPGTATTIVDPEGYTAIRVNLPPIGFNKARISIKIDGTETKLELLDIEVPAVVVIDPGHGGILPATNEAKLAAGYLYSTKRGEWTLDGSATNHALSYGTPTNEIDAQKRTVTEEKSLTLQLGLLFKKDYQSSIRKEQYTGRVIMTRDSDINVGFTDRTEHASEYGADIFLSIHFNGNSSPLPRGSEVWVEPNEMRANGDSNANFSEDTDFGTRILISMAGSIPQGGRRPADGEPRPKGFEPPDSLSIPSDIYTDRNNRLRNEGATPKSRACLAEVEFITNRQVEEAFISGPQSDANRSALSKAMAGAVIKDIKVQQP